MSVLFSSQTCHIVPPSSLSRMLPQWSHSLATHWTPLSFPPRRWLLQMVTLTLPPLLPPVAKQSLLKPCPLPLESVQWSIGVLTELEPPHLTCKCNGRLLPAYCCSGFCVVICWISVNVELCLKAIASLSVMLNCVCFRSDGIKVKGERKWGKEGYNKTPAIPHQMRYCSNTHAIHVYMMWALGRYHCLEL